MSKKLILILIVIIVIAAGGIIGFAGKQGDAQKIKAHPAQTTGTIVESDKLTEYNTNGCWIYFEYTVSGKTYKHCQKYHGWEKADNYFLHYKFPVVYCAEDPDLGRLLITADEYEEFGIAQPDSLKKYNGRIL